ncbi:unnamed protein product [Hanseniaspora opuntiae]
MKYDNALELMHFEYAEDQRKLKKAKIMATLDHSTDKTLAYKKILAQLRDDADENDIVYNYMDQIEGSNIGNELITRHMHDNDINTGFVDADGNIANNNIFKDCYIEANGVIKYHKITDDISDDQSESDESLNEENMKTSSNKEVLNVNKSEFQKQLNRNNLGLGEVVSFGIEKFVSNDIEDTKNKTGKATKYKKELLYDELNGFFLKSYAVETKKLNDKITAASNFNDILLDLDVINSMADEVLKDGSTTFESKEEKEYIEDIVKMFLLNNEKTKVDIKLDSLRWRMNSINGDLGYDHVGSFELRNSPKLDYIVPKLMKSSEDTHGGYGKSSFNKSTKTEEALVSLVHSELMNIAKFLEHENKLRKMTITDT